jgi:hypothetical protein
VPARLRRWLPPDCFHRTTWPVGDLHALISDLPPLPPDTQDECDDEDIDDERERE